MFGNSNDLQEQRVYSPRGMPKRDAATHRKLCQILGHTPPGDECAPALQQLPPDVLNAVGKVVEKNNDLTAQIPDVLAGNVKLKGEVAELRTELGGIRDSLAAIAQALGMNKSAPKTSSDIPEPTTPKKKSGKDLPPPEK